MKLTVNKLRQIIREEVENTLSEARYYTPGGKDDPFNQKYADDPVMASDRGASDEGWDDSPAADFEPKPLNVRIAVVFDDYLQDKSMDDLKSDIEAEEETLMAALDTAGATAEGARELIRRMEQRDEDFAAGKAAYGGGDYLLKALVSRA